MKKNVVIFDLDGTLALNDHRKHLVECPREQQDWKAFYEACYDDAPNKGVIDIFNILTYLGEHEVWIFSGRSNEVKEKTWMWLSEHTNWCTQMDKRLMMRAEGDFTPDDILKKKWAEDLGIERIAMVFDDRQKVVDMWRSLGLTCLQVAPGNF